MINECERCDEAESDEIERKMRKLVDDDNEIFRDKRDDWMKEKE